MLNGAACIPLVADIYCGIVADNAVAIAADVELTAFVIRLLLGSNGEGGVVFEFNVAKLMFLCAIELVCGAFFYN